MGPQRVLQAARWLTVTALALGAALGAPDASAAPARERVAVIDLGPADPAVRKQLHVAVVAAGFAVVSGDGLEEALAGQRVDRDELELAAAIASAQRAFGALDCAETITAASEAAAIAARRQAAGLAVPELERAWTYILLCRDREGAADAAAFAAARLRTVTGSSAPPAAVPADVWRRYPEVDTVLDRDLLPLEITVDVPGAAVWIDFRPAGTAPLTVMLPAGEHVIAVAAGSRRGWAHGTTDRTQRTLAIPTTDQAGPHAALAARIASWRGEVPAAAELGRVLDAVQARVALVRHGATLEVWGRVGRTGAPRRFGDDDGIAPLGEVERLMALAADRVQAWKDRAPDPDQPLLVEDGTAGRDRKARADPPTKWWVYATIAGAVAAGAVVIYLHDAGDDRQRIELHYPRGSR